MKQSLAPPYIPGPATIRIIPVSSHKILILSDRTRRDSRADLSENSKANGSGHGWCLQDETLSRSLPSSALCGGFYWLVFILRQGLSWPRLALNCVCSQRWFLIVPHPSLKGWDCKLVPPHPGSCFFYNQLSWKQNDGRIHINYIPSKYQWFELEKKSRLLINSAKMSLALRFLGICRVREQPCEWQIGDNLKIHQLTNVFLASH